MGTTQPTSDKPKVQAMFSSISERYDLTNTVLSAGVHHWWRRKLFRRIDQCVSNPESKTALDVCTGTGDLIPGLSKRFDFALGVDFCLPMLMTGQKRFQMRTAVPHFVQGDALSLPLADESIDVVTVAYGVRNFQNLLPGLSEIVRVISSGGWLFILEFGRPNHAFIEPLYRFYSRYGMPLIGGVLTGNLEAYRYLPQTALNFPFGIEFCAMLSAGGLRNAYFESLNGGIAYLYWAQK